MGEGEGERKLSVECKTSPNVRRHFLKILSLIMAFEEEFGVEISDEEAEKIRRVKDAVEYIDKHAKAQ